MMWFDRKRVIRERTVRIRTQKDVLARIDLSVLFFHRLGFVLVVTFIAVAVRVGCG